MIVAFKMERAVFEELSACRISEITVARLKMLREGNEWGCRFYMGASLHALHNLRDGVIDMKDDLYVDREAYDLLTKEIE